MTRTPIITLAAILLALPGLSCFAEDEVDHHLPHNHIALVVAAAYEEQADGHREHRRAETRRSAHGQPRTDNQPDNFIELAERFLSTIDAMIRGGDPPKTQLRSWWQAKNRDQYRADLQAWQSVVSKY